MGIIRASIDAIRGGIAESWLEVLEPAPMSDTDCFVPGNKMTQNGKM